MAVSAGAALERVLAETFGPGVEVLARRPGAYRSSHAIEDLDVLVGREPVALLLKDVGPSGLSAQARAAKPPFLIDPQREAEVYERILAERVADAPRLYGAVVEPEARRHWLLLERIDGVPLYEIGELEAWRAAARWLARLRLDCGRERTERLVAIDEAHLLRWLERAERFNPPEDVAWLRPVAVEAARRLAAGQPSFLHGDFYAANVLVERAGRIRPVDWEVAAVGPPLLDLAALTSGSWDDERRADFAAAYVRELSGDPSAVPDAAFAEELECCRLLLAVQWLGWSDRWTPPPEHAHFWLAEAYRAAECL